MCPSVCRSFLFRACKPIYSAHRTHCSCRLVNWKTCKKKGAMEEPHYCRSEQRKKAPMYFFSIFSKKPTISPTKTFNICQKLIWASLLASKKIVKLCMNRPISSLYSVRVRVRAQITALYSFFLQANISIYLFFSFKFCRQYLSIQDSETPSCKSKISGKFEKTFRIHSFSSLSKVLCLCSKDLFYFLHSAKFYVCVDHAQLSFARSIVLFVDQMIYLASTLFVFPRRTYISSSTPVP